MHEEKSQGRSFSPVWATICVRLRVSQWLQKCLLSLYVISQHICTGSGRKMGILYFLMLIPHTQKYKSVWFSTTALYLKGICHLYSLTITSYLVFPLNVSIQFLHVVPDLFGLFHVDLEGETRRVWVDRFEKKNRPCTANLGRLLQTPSPPTSTLCHHQITPSPQHCLFQTQPPENSIYLAQLLG